jgi:DNA-binding MarR family transcriptional regulator
MKRRFLVCLFAAGAAVSSAAYCPAPAAAVLDRAAGTAPSSAAEQHSSLRPGAAVRIKKTSRRGANQSLTSKRRRAIGESAPLEVKGAGRGAEGSGATAPAVLRQLRVVMRAFRNQDERSSDGMSAARVRALALIDSRPGMQVGVFAQELGVHQSTASNLLEPLARQGLIEKRRAADDHRSVSLFVTARAKTILKAAPAGAADGVHLALDRLPPATLTALQERLADLIRALPTKTRLA